MCSAYLQSHPGYFEWRVQIKFLECSKTEEVYQNDSSMSTKVRETEVQSRRVWRYVECVECAGIELELIG